MSSMLKNVIETSEEVTKNDMDSNQGGGFIDKGGVYYTTIEKAFLTKTKKKGIACNLIFGGSNAINLVLYIVSNKGGKLITTCQMNGKTVSLPDFKMFKQLYFVATGEALSLEDMKTKEETISYKNYGKTVEVEGETIIDLIGKDLYIAIREEEKYAYTNGEVDKTDIARDSNGNPYYDKKLYGVFTKDGLAPIEVLKEKEPKMMKDTENFLNSDKAIKRVKLEETKETEIDEDDKIDF